MNDSDKEKQFLKSWKVAVEQLGPELFTVKSTTVNTATHRNDLRPDPEAIERYVNKHHGHHYFLFMVVSFFSYSLIEDIFAEAGIGWPRIIDLSLLDEKERMIVYSLVENFDEW